MQDALEPLMVAARCRVTDGAADASSNEKPRARRGWLRLLRWVCVCALALVYWIQLSV